jgi:hypothetical protein
LRAWGLVLALTAWAAAAGPLPVDDTHLLRVGAADIRLHNGLDWPYAIEVAYRIRPVGTWRVAPAAGVEAATGGARFYYVEAQRDFPIDERWLVIPAFGLGFFQDGSDLDLGHGLQFRTALSFGYRFQPAWRVGVTFTHISNAGLEDSNPGTEEMAVWVSRAL